MTAQIVSLHCVLKNKLGRVISESYSRDVLTVDQSPDAPLRGLTKGLRNIRTGERRKIFVPAEQAYGYYELSRVMYKSLDNFTMKPTIGQFINWPGEDTQYRVTDISGNMVTLDGNHPLAGQDLIFEVKALNARPATTEDLQEADAVGSSFH